MLSDGNGSACQSSWSFVGFCRDIELTLLLMTRFSQLYMSIFLCMENMGTEWLTLCSIRCHCCKLTPDFKDIEDSTKPFPLSYLCCKAALPPTLGLLLPSMGAIRSVSISTSLLMILFEINCCSSRYYLQTDDRTSQLSHHSLLDLNGDWLQIWFVGTALCDILIATSTMYILKKKKTYFHSTSTLITKLVRVSVETGLICAACAILEVILFLAFTNDTFYMPMCASLSKLYSNSLLAVCPSTFGPLALVD